MTKKRLVRQKVLIEINYKNEISVNNGRARCHAFFLLNVMYRNPMKFL